MDKKPNIDQLFEQAFKDFQQEPSGEVWANINDVLFDQSLSNAMDGLEVEAPESLFESIADSIPNEFTSVNKFDAQIKNAFEDFEKEPAPSNWESIQKFLPLSLLLKRYLTFLSSIAAILVVGGLLFYLIGSNGIIDQLNNADKPSQSARVLQAPSPEIGSESNDTPWNAIDADQAKELNSEEAGILIPESGIQDVISGPTAIVEDIQGPILNASTPVQTYTPGSVPDDGGSALIIDREEEAITSNETLNPGPEIIDPTDKKILEVFKLNPFSGGQHFLVDSEEAFDEAYLREGLPLAFQGRRSQDMLIKNNDNSDKREAILFRGAYFSFNTQLLASWTQNQSIRNRIANGGDLNSKAFWTGSYGAGIGYQIKPRLAMEIGWANTRTGQRYKPADGSMTSELKVTYNYFPLTFKYTTHRLKFAKGVPITMSLVAGAHYGRMVSADLSTGVEGISFEDKVIEHELGIHGGFDYLFHLDPSFFVSVGPRFNLGAEAGRIINGGSNNTTNIQAGLNLGVHYRIGQ